MGHYRSEMFPNGKDREFKQRWVRYQQACAREIEEIISKNPIKFKEVFVVEKVRLYSPLNKLSKIIFDDDEPRAIKELFGSSANYYSPEMWPLAWGGNFVVYDKRENDLSLRINEIPKDSFDLFPAWVNMKYFEPIVIHHNNT